MEEITYPINGFQNSGEIIAEAERTGRPIRDLIGRGLPEDYSQDQLIEAYERGDCSESYLAARLHIDRLEARRLLQERAN
jgi:hypothetical protein